MGLVHLNCSVCSTNKRCKCNILVNSSMNEQQQNGFFCVVPSLRYCFELQSLHKKSAERTCGLICSLFVQTITALYSLRAIRTHRTKTLVNMFRCTYNLRVVFTFCYRWRMKQRFPHCFSPGELLLIMWNRMNVLLFRSHLSTHALTLKCYVLFHLANQWEGKNGEKIGIWHCM